MKKYLLGVFLLLVIVATPAPTGAMTTIERQALINRLMTQIAEAKAQVSALMNNQNCMSFNQDLSIGDGEGDDLVPEVKKLQNFLVKKGYLANIFVTGYFGKLTQGALIKWQRVNRLTADGYFRQSSRLVINNTCNVDTVTSPAVPDAPVDTTTPPVTTCTENDGGENYFVSGTTKAASGTYVDFCYEKYPTVVHEYFCSGNVVGARSQACTYGCSN